MSNQLVYKVVPTLNINSVEENLESFQIVYTYNKVTSLERTFSFSDGTILLPGPTALLSKIPFIEFTSNFGVTLTYTQTSGVEANLLQVPVGPTSGISEINYISGNILGYNFKVSSGFTQEILITWKIYTNEP